MILSNFIAKYVVLAASRDNPEAFESNIKLVVKNFDTQTRAIFFHSLLMLREIERPVILALFLSVDIRWAQALLQIYGPTHRPRQWLPARGVCGAYHLQHS